MNEKQKTLRICFLSATDPFEDKKAWSGTIYKLCTAISKKYRVEWVKIPKIPKLEIARKIFKIVSLLIPFRGVSFHHTFFHAKTYGKVLTRILEKKDYDYIFAPVASGYISFLETNIPIIYVTDATFESMYSYYPSFGNFFGFNKKEGNMVEELALRKSEIIIVASDWAKDSVVNDYEIPEEKVHVLEFGANIDIAPNIIKERNGKEEIKLLFLGVDWNRKGGDIAVEVNKLLNQEYKRKSKLRIVGCNLPGKYKNEKDIEENGFLNKNNPDQYSRLVEIIYDSDILLLPTKAECAGIAFSEASAYGLPIFTFDTGGVGNYVYDDVNGYKFNLNSDADMFAKKIVEVLDTGKIEILSRQARKLYESKLNWDVWTEEFEKIIKLDNNEVVI